MTTTNLTNNQLVNLIDLTLLTDNDTEADIINLCNQATTPLGNVAAICIHPQFVKLAATHINQNDISIATVVNFPSGNEPLSVTLNLIKQCLLDGANEIDLVMPYTKLLSGNVAYVKEYISACKQLLTQHSLKIILETGALIDDKNITLASQIAIECGANFIKTSTGKNHPGANPKAISSIINTIQKSNSTPGIKVSGGVRDIATAQQYYKQIISSLGQKYACKSKLRFGASTLLHDIIKTINS